MSGFFEEHGQKIYGSVTTMLGFAMSGIGSGQLDRSLGDNKDWVLFLLGMFVAGLGGATVTRANSVTAKVKVAEAMKIAILASPPNQSAGAD